MNRFLFDATSESDTDLLGRALAELVPSGTTIALIGTLGSGKTRLVQSLAVGCGIERTRVTSPTFVLCQHYEGTKLIHHLDTYRLNDDDEFLELGPEEYFESRGITCVEWADRVHRCLPPEHLRIEIEVTGEQSRRFILSTDAEDLVEMLEQLADRMG